MKVRLPSGKNSNMKDISEQIKSMQIRVENAMEEFKLKEFEDSSGDKDVKVVFNGDYELISLDIKPEIVNPNDVEKLQDLIVVSINKTLKKVKDEKEAILGEVSGREVPDCLL
ncbi:MAG: YbaB/EbfC family nucleoid-associated protein [Candidatus Improbicoccus pseudotrichonymphae]|uniref:Nucleoid-associated protein CfP315_0056 n=1 Tax=Candidatus Improbicoccus pseudotrichonymphae TaxID=3033792 RepID=A0AA48HXM2_9FIRM|nr:MAG: YbaB/EbfC family nucleoid-associated protein [Candidatus Improbicoccus pseudotrichonymphae]